MASPQHAPDCEMLDCIESLLAGMEVDSKVKSEVEEDDDGAALADSVGGDVVDPETGLKVARANAPPHSYAELES